MKNVAIPGSLLSLNDHEVFYNLYNEKGRNTPIIVLNGGPGGSFYSYYVSIRDLATKTDRPILFYDQIGGGRSKVIGKDDSFWVMDTWINELEAIVKKFHFKKAILLGHSFGGMLAIATAIERKPRWLKGLILSSTLCSSKMWEEDTMKILSSLPKLAREALLKGIETGEYDTPEYRRAEAVYYRKCINPNYRYSKKNAPKTEAYLKAWGPSEFAPQGTLKDYDYSDRLNEIKVPTLLIFGGEDESTPRANDYMFDHMKVKRKMVELIGLHHASYKENPDLYMKEVATFLYELSL